MKRAERTTAPNSRICGTMFPTTVTGAGSGVDYLGTKDAAGILGMSQRGVQKMIERQQLPAVKAGRDWLILRSDLEAARSMRRGRPRGD